MLLHVVSFYFGFDACNVKFEVLFIENDVIKVILYPFNQDSIIANCSREIGFVNHK